ncbi:proteinkinasesubdomain-containingproteinpkl/ ccin9 [Gigaspora margarita]|uniref:Proteinkinasesubdomain-containingproteinpkl/ ccin9 n=1 Tax=Gigaspora margarita TaxID=4874 RepID=A0A8H3XIX9_GIGMA|nr:proteinkinasesubdomain-containingproteinpkl/ ccin9 [Gigaspora margarita]
MNKAYDCAKEEYEEAKGKLERLRTLKIDLAAEEWKSEKEKKKWIAEKEQLEREEKRLNTDVEYWKGEMKRLTTYHPATPMPDSMGATLKRKHVVHTYRNVDDIVKRLKKITPSSYSRSKKNPEFSGIILNYRTESPDIPLSLYHSVFATFKDNLSSLKAEADDFKSLGLLVSDMQEFYNDEDARRKNFSSWASKYFNYPVTALPLGGRSEADLHIPFNVNHAKHLLLLGEIKNELGDGNGCPYRKVCASYARFISQKSPPDCYGLHPTFLIYLAGPYLGIAGAVFGENCVIEPLTYLIPLIQLRFDDELLSSAANTFRLLKQSLESLKDYYDKLHLPTEINVDLPRREAYPYPDSFNYKVQFEYKRKLVDGKLLFVVQELTNQQLLVVKFVKTYGADVHKDCAKANIAPKLIAIEKLAGSWFIVVMEYLSSEYFACMYDILLEDSQRASFLTQKATEVANELHKMNYVHGDFRTSNLMISKDGEQVKIVDFDWAGEEGSAKYPHFINRSDSLDWHPDVKEGGKIEKVHDIHFITQSIKKIF